MNIQHWSRQNRPLQRLLQQQQQWQRLQAFLNQKLPRNLSAHCSVACINEQGWLVVMQIQPYFAYYRAVKTFFTA